MLEPTNLRTRILDAAETLMQTGGSPALTQSKVAGIAGIRQSHLQYYFPKRIDLIAGLLRRHVEMAEKQENGESGFPAAHHSDRIANSLNLILRDPGRMRFFLGLVMEADREPALRGLLDEHMAQFQARLAAWFGKAPGDPAVKVFLNALRGYGMVALATGKAPSEDLAALAERLGLVWRDE